MVTQDEAMDLIKPFVKIAQTQISSAIKVCRSVIALEPSKSNTRLDFFASTSIIHQTSNVQTSQQNRVVERKHNYLLKVSRALLFQSNVPLRFLGELCTHSHLLH